MSNASNVNAGVHTNVGMDFQKHCAIYLFLEKYESIKNTKYFIILEHHEDIIFGYLDKNEALEKIETYQAKKSPKAWGITGLIEIIRKIVNAGQEVLEDEHLKSDSFKQDNVFASNNTINLKTGKKPNTVITTVNESNEHVRFADLDQRLKDKILEGNDDVKFIKSDNPVLENVQFRYIDLSRTSKSQQQQLSGKLSSVFGDSITDSNAALDTFLRYLQKVETTFNQGNTAKLLDKSKRLESEEINNLLDLLTMKKMAFDFWRNRKDEICTELNISIRERATFELQYENSFDRFKDLTEGEHLKIYKFVKTHQSLFGKHVKDVECISEFLQLFNKTDSTTLNETQLKAAISASYVEITNTL